MPTGFPEASNSSETVSCRSKLEMSLGSSMPSIDSPGKVTVGRSVCWNSSITWNNGA
ncbi:unannotated protein [freshwater metagenome]|uniref:Unannotated protein n=1 Tax=freshwater metagenome TaxID=449393 RepID=A0A6J7IZR1_9ZZZZ